MSSKIQIIDQADFESVQQPITGKNVDDREIKFKDLKSTKSKSVRVDLGNDNKPLAYASFGGNQLTTDKKISIKGSNISQESKGVHNNEEYAIENIEDSTAPDINIQEYETFDSYKHASELLDDSHDHPE